MSNNYLNKALDFISFLNLNESNLSLAKEYLIAMDKHYSQRTSYDINIIEKVRDYDVITQDFSNLSQELKDRSCDFVTELFNQKELSLAYAYINLCCAIGKNSASFLCHKIDDFFETQYINYASNIVGNLLFLYLEKFCVSNNFNFETTRRICNFRLDSFQYVKDNFVDTKNHTKLAIALCCLSKDEFHKDEYIKEFCDFILKENEIALKSLNLSSHDLSLSFDYINNKDIDAKLNFEDKSLLVKDIDNAILVYSQDKLFFRSLIEGLLPVKDNTNKPFFKVLIAALSLAKDYDARAKCAFNLYVKINPCLVLESLATFSPNLLHMKKELDTLSSPIKDVKALIFLSINDVIFRGNFKTFNALLREYKEYLPLAKTITKKHNLHNISSSLDFDSKVDPNALIYIMLKEIQGDKSDYINFITSEDNLENIQAQDLSNIVIGSIYSNISTNKLVNKVCNYYDAKGWDKFLARFVICIFLHKDIYKGYYLGNLFGYQDNYFKLNIREFTDFVLTEKLSLENLLYIYAILNDVAYIDVTPIVKDIILEKIALKDVISCSLKSVVFARSFCISLSGDYLNSKYTSSKDKELCKKALIKCMGDSSIAIRKKVKSIIEQHSDFESDILNVFKTAKKANARILAISLLDKDKYAPLFKESLDSEKNAKVISALHKALNIKSEDVDIKLNEDDLIKKLLTSKNIKKLEWLLNDGNLVRVRLKDSTDENKDLVQALLVSYSEFAKVGICDIAKKIALKLNADDLHKLARYVLDKWVGLDAPSKTKWVLAFATVFGDSSITDTLKHLINEWPQNARGAIACEAVKALAIGSDNNALLFVDGISRKFKFKQVKNAAKDALVNAAKELNIDVEELSDRIVPNLGFPKNGVREFSYGTRNFTVALSPSLELIIKNDANKVIKTLPAVGKSDDESIATKSLAEFKELKKQIKNTISSQKDRLDYALACLRLWTKDKWETLFVENPIMHQFAISLIWGIYNDKNELQETFRYMEDGSFTTVDEEEYTLESNAKIGLVHPLELDESTIKAWQQQLEDYEITQSIAQLNRPIYRVEDLTQNIKEKELKHFGGKKLLAVSLQGKLQKFNWYRGSVQDAGCFYEYYKENSNLGLGVELNFSGTYVGFDIDEEITLYDVVFYKANTVDRGSYIYDKPKEQDIYALCDVDKRFFSETIYELELSSASSTENDPNWEQEYYRY